MRSLDRIFRVKAIAAAARKVFTPASLFKAGEPGAWYDPSDFSTLFQDSAGTTPVTAVEQPVGLMLDKRLGLVLGPELVTNGGFSQGTTGWDGGFGGSTSQVVNGELEVTGNGGSFPAVRSSAFTTVVGSFYKVTATARRGTTTSAVQIAAAGVNVTTSAATNTPLTLIFAATSTSTQISLLIVSGTGTGTAYFDNISVRELPGNHAFQSTSANRPVLSARVNLLTKTEDFNNSGWNNYSSFTYQNIDDPAGGTSATRVFGTAIANTLNQTLDATALQYTHTVYLRVGTYTPAALVRNNTSSTNLIAVSSIGVSGSNAYGSWTITTVNNSWKKLTLVVTSGIAVGDTLAIYAGATGAVGNGNYFDIWHPDLRVTNTGVNLPAYQRVNTSTDYDTVGFPLYLKANGTNSSMQTNRINFSATDKVTVVAGLRRLSDTQERSLFELGNSAGSWQNGSFGIAANIGVSPYQAYQLISKGTSQATIATGNYTSPITNVLTAVGNIASPEATLRVNGTQAATSSASQGTGNYGNYPLYLFARAGTSLFFNGQFYGCVIRGGQSTQAQITATEQWLNQKTKAF